MESCPTCGNQRATGEPCEACGAAPTGMLPPMSTEPPPGPTGGRGDAANDADRSSSPVGTGAAHPPPARAGAAASPNEPPVPPVPPAAGALGSDGDGDDDRVGRSPRRAGLVVAVALVCLAVVVGGLALVMSGDGDGDTVDVELVAADEPGPDPFTDEAAAEAALGFSTAEPPDGEGTGAQESGVRLLSTKGTSAGLYGSRPEGGCDPAALGLLLAAEPEVAKAWAELMGIEVDDIGATLERLTPVVLGRDTLVVNTAYAQGEVRRFPAVLQAGTPVLVDAAGVPRVKCSCGNPLLEPASLDGDVRFQGEAWSDFDRRQITLVDPASAPADELVTVDVESGEQVAIPTRGRPREEPTTTTTSAPPPTTTAPPPPPTTTAPAVPVLTPEGLGDLKVGSRLEDAKARGLVGPDEEGCTLAGPGDRTAPLTIAGAEGWAHFYDGELYTITLTRGSVVSPGAQIGMAQVPFVRAVGGDYDAYGSSRYRAELDTSFEEMFGIWVLTLRDRASGATLEASIDPAGEVVDTVNAPAIAFCE